MVLAAVLQLYAGLAASALAAVDDYVTAAVSYILASVVGLGYILVRIDADGIDAVAAGMALNGAVAVALPTLALGLRGRSEAMPRSAIRPAGPPIAERLLEAGRSVALPLALQAVYLICLPFAAQRGCRVGDELQLRVPRGVRARRRHIVVARPRHVGAARPDRPRPRAGRPSRRLVVLARASSPSGRRPACSRSQASSLVGAVLGDSYLADVGEELGRLIALLAPWMVFMIGFSVTLPLLFVQGRTRGLLVVAPAARRPARAARVAGPGACRACRPLARSRADDPRRPRGDAPPAPRCDARRSRALARAAARRRGARARRVRSSRARPRRGAGRRRRARPVRGRRWPSRVRAGLAQLVALPALARLSL